VKLILQPQLSLTIALNCVMVTTDNDNSRLWNLPTVIEPCSCGLEALKRIHSGNENVNKVLCSSAP
jgi:hypothetical protein